MVIGNDTTTCLDPPFRGRLPPSTQPHGRESLFKRQFETRFFDVARTGSYGPALEVTMIQHSPKKETAS